MDDKDDLPVEQSHNYLARYDPEILSTRAEPDLHLTVTEIGAFVLVLLRNHALGITGSVFLTFMGFIFTYVSKAIPPWIFHLGAASIFLNACFDSWRREYHRRINLRNSLVELAESLEKTTREKEQIMLDFAAQKNEVTSEKAALTARIHELTNEVTSEKAALTARIHELANPPAPASLQVVEAWMVIGASARVEPDSVLQTDLGLEFKVKVTPNANLTFFADDIDIRVRPKGSNVEAHILMLKATSINEDGRRMPNTKIDVIRPTTVVCTGSALRELWDPLPESLIMRVTFFDAQTKWHGSVWTHLVLTERDKIKRWIGMGDATEAEKGGVL